MNYNTPSWYGNKKIDFARVTDQQLTEQKKLVERFQAENTEKYASAIRTCNKMVEDAATIFGERSDSYKDIRRASRKIPAPPDLVKAYNKLRQTVTDARQNEARLAHNRERDRARRQRRKDLAESDYRWEYDTNTYPRDTQEVQ